MGSGPGLFSKRQRRLRLLFVGLSTAIPSALALAICWIWPGSYSVGATLTAFSIFLGFFVSCVAFRCPRCGLNWGWHAARRRPSMEWPEFLWKWTKCPECGYAEDED